MQRYLQRSPLVIFAWPNSHRLAEELISSNFLEKAPGAILSIKGKSEVEEDRLLDSLLAIYEHLEEGVESAVQFGRKVGLEDRLELYRRQNQTGKNRRCGFSQDQLLPLYC